VRASVTDGRIETSDVFHGGSFSSLRVRCTVHASEQMARRCCLPSRAAPWMREPASRNERGARGEASQSRGVLV